MASFGDSCCEGGDPVRAYRYCPAATAATGPRFAGSFHDDAVIDHGEPMPKQAFVREGPRAAFVRLWELTQHMLGQIHVELDGPVPTARPI